MCRLTSELMRKGLCRDKAHWRQWLANTHPNTDAIHADTCGPCSDSCSVEVRTVQLHGKICTTPGNLSLTVKYMKPLTSSANKNYCKNMLSVMLLCTTFNVFIYIYLYLIHDNKLGKQKIRPVISPLLTPSLTTSPRPLGSISKSKALPRKRCWQADRPGPKLSYRDHSRPGKLENL